MVNSKRKIKFQKELQAMENSKKKIKFQKELQAMEEDGLTQEVITLKREAPPAHYGFKIESFSQLLEFLSRTGSEKYNSGEFDVAGYNWKLSLYPKGDTKRNGSDHISLYLVLSETNNLPFGSEVNAFFRLFAYDQIQDKYLMVQDVRKSHMRFHAMKTECGVSQFIPLITFNDASSGYLVNDCCMFGVEVFVTKSTGKGETVLAKKLQKTITHKMEKFSKLQDEQYKSSTVDIAGSQWCLRVYPKGHSKAVGKYLSMFLEPVTLEQKVWADFKLRVKNQVHEQHYEKSINCWFDASEVGLGIHRMLLLNDLKDEANGYILKDTVIVEIEVTQILAVKDFS